MGDCETHIATGKDKGYGVWSMLSNDFTALDICQIGMIKTHGNRPPLDHHMGRWCWQEEKVVGHLDVECKFRGSFGRPE